MRVIPCGFRSEFFDGYRLTRKSWYLIANLSEEAYFLTYKLPDKRHSWNFMTENKKTLAKIDKMDRRILEQIQQDGSLTNQELAEKVGLSPSPCLRRVRALEDAGIIVRTVTILDHKKLGLSLTAIILIGMDRHTPERFAAFEEQVAEYPEVQECYLITGQDADYMLKVVVPDMDHYHHFLLNRITRIQGVSGVHSSFVLRRVIDSTALPLGYLS
jgi:Lrp/AsnC family leucine-responsive transcriptional regulator|tara:strand:- start:746 stop:1390 length:645 start_codon:yes stop_codon:yes gene_type:complete